MRARAGFTLIDLIAVVVVVAVGGVMLGHATTPAKREALGLASMRNLHVIGQMADAYRADHAGRIVSYSWKGGREYQIAEFSVPAFASDDMEAHAWQNTDLLRRLTGRTSGSDQIRNNSSRIPDRRFSHLILADYFGFPPNAELWASPGDRNLRDWQSDPLDIDAVPYADGFPDWHDSDSKWAFLSARQRWAYASSYQWVPTAFCADRQDTWGPTNTTPHLFNAVGRDPPMGGRRFRDVRYPSNKVFIFEEFEWRPRFDWGSGTWQSDGIWGTYNRARSAKLMFDGSVHDRPAAEANRAWDPNRPDLYAIGGYWQQRYVPLDTFPLWPGGIDTKDDPIDQRFRWTAYGLQGIDYTWGDLAPRQTNRSFTEELGP